MKFVACIDCGEPCKGGRCIECHRTGPQEYGAQMPQQTKWMTLTGGVLVRASSSDPAALVEWMRGHDVLEV